MSPLRMKAIIYCNITKHISSSLQQHLIQVVALEHLTTLMDSDCNGAEGEVGNMGEC